MKPIVGKKGQNIACFLSIIFGLLATFISIYAFYAACGTEKPKIELEIARNFAMFAAASWAIYAWLHERYKENQRSVYQYLNELHDQYLGAKVLSKRKNAIKAWQKYIVFPNDFAESTFPDCEQDIIKAVKAKLGIEITMPTEDEISEMDQNSIKDTEYICNLLEQLGKMRECKAVDEDVLKIFFYTMLADTFLMVLPYICYRRTTKTKWAHKFQSLVVREFPDLSADPRKV